MNTLPLLPFVAVGALFFAPTAVYAPASGDATTPPHPHFYKAMNFACVNGKINLSWYTVPFNADHLKELKPNFMFNRGFGWKSDVDVMVGDQKVAAGDYNVAFQLDDTGKQWNWVLSPGEINRLQNQLRQAKRRNQDTAELEKKLAAAQEKGGKPMKLPCKTFKGETAEHLEITAINHGYKVVGRGNANAASGAEGELRVSWGDIHIALPFAEAFVATEASDRPARRRRR